jgi:hypothetical protein
MKRVPQTHVLGVGKGNDSLIPTLNPLTCLSRYLTDTKLRSLKPGQEDHGDRINQGGL